MVKDEQGREVPSRFYMDMEGLVFSEAAPLTQEDLAELAAMKQLMGIKEEEKK